MIGIVPGLKAYFERADRTFDCFRKDGPYGMISTYHKTDKFLKFDLKNNL